MKTVLTSAMWAKYWSELPVAVSLGDALGISEVRLPRQSIVAFNFRVWRLCQNLSVYRPDCLFQTVTGFWEVTPVNHVDLRTYRTDHR